MPLYLIHCKPSGEPVGIWDDAGKSYYVDPSWQNRGQAVVESKGSKAPWSEYVEDLTHTPPHVSMWQAEDQPGDEIPVLDDARKRFFSLSPGALR